MTRLAIARLWYEGNSFSPVQADLAAFRQKEWLKGAEVAARARGTATELGGALAFLDRHPDWQADFLRCAAANPAGPVAEDLFADWLEEVIDALSNIGAGGPYDALYLSLHGALCTPGLPDADLYLLQAIRAACPDLPIAVTFDLHANLSPRIADLVTIATGYRTHPHIDMAETADRALTLLADTLAGRIQPRLTIAKVPALLHSHHMRTDAGPMAEMMALARAASDGTAILDISVFGGFVWGDSPDAGASIMALFDGKHCDDAQAGAVTASLGEALLQRRGRFAVQLPDAATGARQALDLARQHPDGLIALIDPADNPLSGGIADTPGLLDALLTLPAEARAGVPIRFAFLHDPTLVRAAHKAGVGAQFTARLGARLTADFGPPLEAKVTVIRLTDGRFTNDGPMEAGVPVDLGPTAVLRTACGIEIIAASTCQAMIDPACFRLHGLGDGATGILAVKAKNHFRAAFGARCAAFVDVDAPGPAGLALDRLPFRHVPPALRQA